MKILAISDIYSNEYIIEELYERVSKYKLDLVLVAGGISYPGENNAQYILEELLKIANIVLFVPGGTDLKNLNVENDNLKNLDNSYFLFEKNKIKVGFLGLGGVPNRSIRRKDEFPYRWEESIYREKLKNKLELNYNKLKLENPDYIILITHSPPYHISDFSKKIILSKFQIQINYENVEKLIQKKKASNPVLLGSHIIKRFVKNHKIDLHLFGHIHKEGGKIIKNDDTIFVNISHLSPLPYKLTGRKFCLIELSPKIVIKFKHLVNKNLEFNDFLHTYL